MTAVAVNIHEFYNELKGAGFTEQQAEVIANIQGKTATVAFEQSHAEIEQVKQNYRLDDITTNKDLDARIKETELKIELVRKDIEIVKSDLMRDIEGVRKDIEKSRNDLIKWFVGTAFAIASIGFMLARFFTNGIL